jgi:hypothetical protein
MKSFEGTLTDIGDFRDVLTNISRTIDEGILQIRKDGFKFIATDRAMTSVVDLSFHKSAFSSYNYTKDMNIGIRTESLCNILRRFDGEVKIVSDENNIEIISKAYGDKRFKMSLMSLEDDSIPPSKSLDFPSSFEITTNELTTNIEDAGIFSDTFRLKLSKDSLEFSSKSENGGYNNKIEVGKSLISVNSPKEMQSVFKTDLFGKLILSKSDLIKIEMGNDYPIRMNFKSPSYDISWIVAPQVV